GTAFSRRAAMRPAGAPGAGAGSSRPRLLGGSRTLPASLARPRGRLADGVGDRPGATLVPGRTLEPAGRDATGDAVRPRTRPLPAARPLAPLVRVAGRRPVLVAPGRLVGAARTPRGRGAVLRRMGDLGTGRRPRVRRRAG